MLLVNKNILICSLKFFQLKIPQFDQLITSDVIFLLIWSIYCTDDLPISHESTHRHLWNFTWAEKIHSINLTTAKLKQTKVIIWEIFRSTWSLFCLSLRLWTQNLHKKFVCVTNYRIEMIYRKFSWRIVNIIQFHAHNDFNFQTFGPFHSWFQCLLSYLFISMINFRRVHSTKRSLNSWMFDWIIAVGYRNFRLRITPEPRVALSGKNFEVKIGNLEERRERINDIQWIQWFY